MQYEQKECGLGRTEDLPGGTTNTDLQETAQPTGIPKEKSDKHRKTTKSVSPPFSNRPLFPVDPTVLMGKCNRDAAAGGFSGILATFQTENFSKHRDGFRLHHVPGAPRMMPKAE
ncbi:hypothetical protein E5288_WYG005682 [Bos mutus]|uniref:Uncharacterized protein n=1 Tax=Bos mutus TaxID=72004 RepID=A0A6B0RX70_9CETA|nr:hypothetical protein [Bos mutus]